MAVQQFYNIIHTDKDMHVCVYFIFLCIGTCIMYTLNIYIHNTYII